MEKKILLQAKALKKSFPGKPPIPILKQISITLHAGESIAIIGASGQGKSTLLQILGTLDQPCGGELEIAGKNALAHPAEIRGRHIGFVFQNYNLLEDYTALQNVLMPALIQKKAIYKHSPAHLRALSLLESVHLSPRKDFMTKLLSGGEKQRVAFARALCNDPEILLADEPSGNLDQESAKIIHTLLLDSARIGGKGVMIVTHDKVLAKLCDRIYTLCDGELHG